MDSDKRCANCRFAQAVWLHQTQELQCRRHAPIYLIGGDAYGRTTVWPPVTIQDSCGEWEPKNG